jgi:hypothetical protein
MRFHLGGEFFREQFDLVLTFCWARELRISHDGFVFFWFTEKKTFNCPFLSSTSCLILSITHITTFFPAVTILSCTLNLDGQDRRA